MMMMKFTKESTMKARYDYTFQAWVNENGVILPCAHPNSPRCGCTAGRYAGLNVAHLYAKKNAETGRVHEIQ